LVEWKQNNSLGNVGAVGCKIRLGLNSLEQGAKVYMHVVHAANQAGLDYITVHGRHAKQKSSDAPTWAAVGEVKAVANMPVIGNGDVASVEDAEALMKLSNCDGVMIARAAIKNPWIFQDFCVSATTDSGNSAGGSSHYWPTQDEVIVARDKYRLQADMYHTKEKFVKFHEANFGRLSSIAKSGDRSLKVHTPNTIHMK
jgi:tRNA-dihydrouridine synthase